jgi:hypothetical protein
MMALLGGMGFALILAFGIFWVGLQDLSLALVLVVTGALIGTAAGWAASGFSARASRYRRFRRDIRIQLVAGHWAVLAHEVPGTHQAAAVQLLREGSIGWCALSAPWLKL